MPQTKDNIVSIVLFNCHYYNTIAGIFLPPMSEVLAKRQIEITTSMKKMRKCVPYRSLAA